jgi:hypothetical protein
MFQPAEDAPSVSQLPVEIWLRIFSFLEYSLDEEEAAWLQGLSPPPFHLKPVCLVSRELRDLAQPLLHRHIPADGEIRHLVFNTLSRRPDLGRAVRTLRVGGQRNDQERIIIPSAFTEARGWLLLPLGFADYLSSRIWRGSDDASMAFLLMLTPNLWCLKLECTDIPQFVSRVFAGLPGSSLHGFPFLRDLVLTPGSDTSLHDPSWIRDWADAIFHPNIKTVHANEIVWSSSEAAKLQGSTSNLEKLRLDRSLIDSAGFVDILSRYERLQSLIIIWGSPGWTILENGVGLDELGQALRSKAQYLEYLDLDPSRCTHNQTLPSPGRIGSLRELANLKTLRIGPDVLIGASGEPGAEDALPLYSVLPLSLEHLHLFPCTSKYFSIQQISEEIYNLLRSGTLPCLRYIRADLWPWDPQEAPYVDDFSRSWDMLELHELGWETAFVHSDEGLTYVTLTRNLPTTTHRETLPPLS